MLVAGRTAGTATSGTSVVLFIGKTVVTAGLKNTVPSGPLSSVDLVVGGVGGMVVVVQVANISCQPRSPKKILLAGEEYSN